MEPVNWSDLLKELEAEVASIRGEQMLSKVLRQKVAHILQQAEYASADAKIIDHLDFLLIKLTEATKENVCTNIQCPHYNKKCRMR